jgi:thiosulfate/3-mercaptopyruvate sulfurtransferase
MNNLVSTTWLADHLYAHDLVVLDASWHMPATSRVGRTEFLKCRIPGSCFFDIDEISDTSSALPHMLPSAEVFATKVSAMGISNMSRIVCYDSAGLFSAARCWWMFKAFGHDNVAVLDGGLKKWLAEELNTEDGPRRTPAATRFHASLRDHVVATIDDVAKASQIADARSSARFRGEEQEPRPGVKPGHMPNASNIHYASLLNLDGTMKSVAELGRAFSTAGIDVSRPIITSCGSGVTAAILSLALSQLGAPNHSLYDGSWTEWGASGRPVMGQI